ncbi:hypothetical protein [Candidatus Phycorickettsia trachydisci]|uniref:hypothetical protein n=1 Tax=Candidatus Phycorickettsia trachydisci TaxID=2115978 RepID=UPI00131A5EB8|nr:hypothetical protein [Candidatus Phycorickettsia trachydisci]
MNKRLYPIYVYYIFITLLTVPYFLPVLGNNESWGQIRNGGGIFGGLGAFS